MNIKHTLIALLTLIPLAASADTYVNGYIRRDGTYVQGHMRSSPNGTSLDNWSTRGNSNPYTGERGHRSEYGQGYGGGIGHWGQGYGSYDRDRDRDDD